MQTTNTTQNKEELERAINKCARESSDGIFVYRYIKNYYEKALSQAHQSGIEEGAEAERKRIKTNIGFLRQFINEKPEKMLVTNEDIEEWLFDFEPLRGKNEVI